MERSQTGSPQDLLTRTCARSCRIPTRSSHGPAQDPILLAARFVQACAWTLQKSHFMREFSGNHAAPQDCNNRFVRACAVEMHLDISEEPFYARSYKENVAPRTASQRGRNALGHLKRAVLRENLQGKHSAPRSSKAHGADFVRACAIEMHMDMSLEQFYARIYRKKAGSRMEHPDQAPALTPTVRNLFSVEELVANIAKPT